VSKKRRIYKPRLVDGKVMMTADLRCLLKYMPDERIDHISDEMRAVVESEWPELAHKRVGTQARPRNRRADPCKLESFARERLLAMLLFSA